VYSYKVRQIDAHGQVLSERHVEASSYNAVLRQLDAVAQDTQHIEVYNQDGEVAGQVNADFWRQKMRRR
jgi:hypothetical protein